MEYNFKEVEKKWQSYWKENQTYKVDVDPSKPKFYVLDMFPYPSGAGLHVGHPLGYIASDIYSRYKRLKGFNVLHPMGFDAYGLPAEQYAIQTGQHPAITTEKNIARYREQLDKIGFSFDWDREVRTCDPKYYKWTQWAFIQMFNHWFNKDTQKAEPIAKLVETFEKEGNANINAANSDTPIFTAEAWKAMDIREQQRVLLNYRIAYLADVGSGDNARRDAPIIFRDTANHAACRGKAPSPNMRKAFAFQETDLFWRGKAILLAHLEPLNELRCKSCIFYRVRCNAMLFKIFKLLFRCRSLLPHKSRLVPCKVASLDAEEILDGVH